MYNDYGGGEDSSGPALPLILSGLANELTEMPVGENKYHDIAVSATDFGEEEFFESVHEGRLFTTHYSGMPRMVDFVMFRKDVVDHILENRVIEKYVGEGKGTGGHSNCYVYYSFKDILNDIPAFLDAAEEHLGLLKAKSSNMMGVTGESLDPEMLGMMDRFALSTFNLSRVFDYKHPNKVAKHVGCDDYRTSSIVNTASEISKSLSEGNRQGAEELLVELIRGNYLNGFMEATRVLWMPGGFEGSQSQEVQEYRLLTKAINTVLDTEEARWAEENGE